MLPFRLTVLAAAVACAAGNPSSAWSQAQPAQPAPAAPGAPADTLLKAEQLEQLLAPIALYPDTLLAQVLMASTYPLEVVEASRWADQNKNLKGEQLQKAAEAQSWDDSVKGLVLTPSVLSMMSEKLSWTQKLGDAVLAQQPDVMDAVQRLRSRAQAQKKLETTKEQKVSVKTESNKQVIVIEPAQPDTLYVPYYDPGVVYGAWPYASYPPYYFPPAPGYYAGGLLATGLAFGAGVAFGAWASNVWGNNVNWGNNNINVNRNVNINNANIGQRGNWQHNPQHRQGVRYNNANVAQQFGKGNSVRGGAGAQNRMDFRGRDGQQVLNPDNRGGNVADRAGDRGSNIGDRGGQRGDRAGDRGGGQRGDRAGDRGGRGGGDRAGNRGGGDRGGARAGGGGGNRGGAMNVGGGGRNAMAQSARGHASLGGGGGGGPRVSGGGGGGARAGGGGGGARAGGGGGGRGGGGGGGRRSDIILKHDVVLLGWLDNGLGFYRFAYNGSDKTYVGVIAQDVQTVMPDAVFRGPDGYLRVRYDTLGVPFQSYDAWVKAGARIPARSH